MGRRDGVVRVCPASARVFPLSHFRSCSFSLEPAELKSLVTESERAWQALGQVTYGPSDVERNSMVFRRSIYVSEDIAEDDFFTSKNLRIVRPGDGAPPSLLTQLIGKKARRAFRKGSPLILDDLLS